MKLITMYKEYMSRKFILKGRMYSILELGYWICLAFL